MGTVLVTGAASGIGHAFVSSLSQNPKVAVIYAVDRSFKSGQDVQSAFFIPYHTPCRIELVRVDVTDEESVRVASGQIGQDLRERQTALDLVVHSAGVRGLDPAVPIRQSSDVAKAETLDAMTVKTLEKTLQVNLVGSFVLLRALVPLLSTSSKAPAKVLVMSSRMGSIGHNDSGGAYAYRASKAAQNALVRSLAIDYPTFQWLLMHPGRVETGLVAIKEEGAISPEESVDDMMSLLQTMSKTSSISFIDRFGNTIPW
ncbi:MAG: hypothetical protein Q9162_000272 [Coniocarpon cinnabarinum]